MVRDSDVRYGRQLANAGAVVVRLTGRAQRLEVRAGQLDGIRLSETADYFRERSAQLRRSALFCANRIAWMR